MILSTTDTIQGRNLAILGLAQGSVVQSKHFGKDIGASFKTLVGGEIKGYTEMMNEARNQATQRMVEHANQMGADAVVGMRYMSSSVMQGAAEMVAYGTAVKFV